MMSRAEWMGMRASSAFYMSWLKNPIRLFLAYHLRRWVCEACGSKVDVRMESSRTMYHYEGKCGSRHDPNRDIGLCRECAEKHHEYWDDRWTEYYNSIGY